MWWYILGTTIGAVLLLWRLLFKTNGDLDKIPYGCHFIKLLWLSNADLWRMLSDLTDSVGDRYLVTGFSRTVIHTSRPDDIAVILTNPRYFKKGLVYKFVIPWLGTGLFLSSGAKWHRRRKILTPTFHFSILKNFAGVIEEKSRDLVQQLRREARGRSKLEVDVMKLISDCTLNIICETAMSIKLDKDSTDKPRAYKQAVLDLGSLVVRRIPRIWFWWDFLYFKFSEGRLYQNHLKTISTFADEIITTRQKEMLFQHENINKEEASTKGLALLDLLLEAERNGEIDLEGIKEEVNTFIFAGHDTTAVALSFGLMLLAKHQHVQDKLMEEIQQVVGGSGRAVTMSDLADMKYLDAVVKEMLRLYPSVPFITRTVTEDFQMGDVLVKRGTELALHFYDLHRRADMFEQPEQFRPERFLLAAPRHAFALVPFSAGPRNCIGQRFALLEVKLVVCAVLQHFRLSPRGGGGEEPLLQTNLVLRPVHPIYLDFTPRS